MAQECAFELEGAPSAGKQVTDFQEEEKGAGAAPAAAGAAPAKAAAAAAPSDAADAAPAAAAPAKPLEAPSAEQYTVCTARRQMALSEAGSCDGLALPCLLFGAVHVKPLETLTIKLGPGGAWRCEVRWEAIFLRQAGSAKVCLAGDESR